MFNAPLARDQAGNPFELPETAAFWRVRRHTGGRPSTVLGPDGEPLFLPITADHSDLYAAGCDSGSFRLEAVDAQRRPLGAQVAFIELATLDRGGPPAVGHNDLVKAGFDSMRMTMEAMQRAQVERERALAQKERALTEAQVAIQRMHTDMMVALVERVGNALPQDAVTVVKQAKDIQKVLGPRNAGLLPAHEKEESTDAEEEGPKAPPWLEALKPFGGLVATMGQEVLVKAVAKDDPEKERELRNNFALYTKMFGGDAGVVAAPGVDTSGSDAQLLRPRAVREIFAQLDDEEVDPFDTYLDSLSDDEFHALCREAAAITDIGQRVSWARTRLGDGGPPREQPRQQNLISQIPPALLPIVMQLSEEERQWAAQIASTLDVAKGQKLVEKLASLPVDEAVRRVRSMIAAAKKRSASVAHRAAEVIFDDEDGAVAGGAA
jgi:hypothetical protein